MLENQFFRILGSALPGSHGVKFDVVKKSLLTHSGLPFSGESILIFFLFFGGLVTFIQRLSDTIFKIIIVSEKKTNDLRIWAAN